MFYGPGTEGGGDDGLKCADEPPCKPLVACTLAATTDISECEMVPSDYCHLQPGRISLPCTCGEVIFGEPGSPKCPE